MMKKMKTTKNYIMNNRKFNKLTSMKTFAYYNMRIGETKIGYEMQDDEIYKEYWFNKQERRLLCEKIYDKEEKLKKELEKHQLKLFTDG